MKMLTSAALLVPLISSAVGASAASVLASVADIVMNFGSCEAVVNTKELTRELVKLQVLLRQRTEIRLERQSGKGS